MNTAITLKEGYHVEKRVGAACPFFSSLSLIILFYLTLISSPAHAELKPMNQGELRSATAQAGFTDFSIDGDTARLFLDIHIETNATIQKLTAGTSLDIYQNWTDIRLGTDTENLTIDGLVFLADFKENTLSTNPELERIVIGSNYLNGTISGTFTNFTGIYNSTLNAITGGGSPDSALAGINLGASQFTFTSTNEANPTKDSQQGLFFILNVESGNVGVQVVAGYNEKNIPDSPSSGSWWDSP